MLSFSAEWACIQAANSTQILLHYAKKKSPKNIISLVITIRQRKCLLHRLMKSGMCPRNAKASSMEIEKQKRSSQGIIWCIFTIYCYEKSCLHLFLEIVPTPLKIIEKQFFLKKAKKLQLPPPPPPPL